jgi:methylmalonyl-CoA epimerase
LADIKHFDHIGMIAPELDSQVAFLSGLLGFRKTHEWEDANARGVMMDVPGKTGVRWEVLSPKDGSPLQHAGAGLHHVRVEVDDPSKAAEELRAAGASPSGDGDQLIVGPQGGGEGFTFTISGRGKAGLCTDSTANAAKMPSTDAPTLGIRAIDHICHAYPDRDALAAKFERQFGMRQIWRTPDGAWDDFADLVLETPAQMLWEVIMPIGDESFIQRFLDKRGPAIHHIAFEVEDWDQAIAACEHHGVPVFDESTGETDGGAWRDIFIHPKNTGGILIQFFWEEKPATWIRSDKIRPPGFSD